MFTLVGVENIINATNKKLKEKLPFHYFAFWEKIMKSCFQFLFFLPNSFQVVLSTVKRICLFSNSNDDATLVFNDAS